MVARPEKLHERVSPFFITISSRLAISVTQICMIGYKCHPDLYFNRICTFPIKVFQGKILFYLLEELM